MSTTSTARRPDRTRPPAPSNPPRPFRFPDFERHRLDNGLEVVVARTPGVPLVDLRLLLPAGVREEGRRPAGTMGLHAALLDEGTRRHDAVEIARRVERLGGSLSTGADPDSAWASAGTLSADTDAALELLAEVVREPTFPERELGRLRGQWLAELARRRTQPSSLASTAFLRAVYADGPYARRTIGTADGLRRIERSLLVEVHEERLRPRGSVLVAVGDLEPAHLLDLVRRQLSDWADRGRPAEARLPKPTAGEQRVILVDRPQATQSELILGHAAVERAHPDVPALLVLNGILGGKFTSRLNLVLREEKGVTYGVRSAFDLRRGPGPFRVSAALSTDAVGDSIRRILAELDRLRDERVPEAELTETRDYLVGTFPYTVQTQSGVADRLETLVLHDLPDDYYSTYPWSLRNVGAEEVLCAARTHLRPREAAIVVAGPAKELEDQLGPDFAVTVLDPDEVEEPAATS